MPKKGSSNGGARIPLCVCLCDCVSVYRCECVCLYLSVCFSGLDCLLVGVGESLCECVSGSEGVFV